MEVGDRAGEGKAYGNLGNTNQSLGDFAKAIEYHTQSQQRLSLAGGYAKAIEYHAQHLATQ